jgi:hypothetical protein
VIPAGQYANLAGLDIVNQSMFVIDAA